MKTPAGNQSTVDSALASERALAAQIAGAQAQLRQAEINLGFTEIRAPIDGKISRTEITEGNVVSPTSGTLATIVSMCFSRSHCPPGSICATAMPKKGGSARS